jgi:hypothetical protein
VPRHRCWLAWAPRSARVRLWPLSIFLSSSARRLARPTSPIRAAFLGHTSTPVMLATAQSPRRASCCQQRLEFDNRSGGLQRGELCPSSGIAGLGPCTLFGDQLFGRAGVRPATRRRAQRGCDAVSAGEHQGSGRHWHQCPPPAMRDQGPGRCFEQLLGPPFLGAEDDL